MYNEELWESIISKTKTVAENIARTKRPGECLGPSQRKGLIVL